MAAVTESFNPRTTETTVVEKFGKTQTYVSALYRHFTVAGVRTEAAAIAAVGVKEGDGHLSAPGFIVPSGGRSAHMAHPTIYTVTIVYRDTGLV